MKHEKLETLKSLLKKHRGTERGERDLFATKIYSIVFY